MAAPYAGGYAALNEKAKGSATRSQTAPFGRSQVGRAEPLGCRSLRRHSFPPLGGEEWRKQRSPPDRKNDCAIRRAIPARFAHSSDCPAHFSLAI